MLKTTFFNISLFYFLLPPLVSVNLNAQSKDIIGAFENYTKAPRELAYIHLNKSTYIKGEMIGFAAYILDKTNKTPSTNTTNLYVTILNNKDSIIKKKLLRVNNGFSNNVFEIDSAFTSGIYTLRAYTNWMRNFDEDNFFEQKIEIIDPDTQTQIETKKQNSLYQIQILPEGGHLLKNVQNTVGIIVKNKNGIGLANAKGHITNNAGEILSEFTLNNFGIAKTLFIPKTNEPYQIVVFNDDNITHSIDNIKNRGINLSLNKAKNGIILTFRTNDSTVSSIKAKTFKIIIHNGYDFYDIDLNFNKEKEISKLIKEEYLFKGVNIITVFDNDNTPILERMYFNFNEIKPLKSNISFIKKDSDSLNIKFSIPTNNYESSLNNVSVSVLPRKTKSYNFHSNILSKVYLEPYVRGFIQNSGYYFENISDKTLYDLDNLLLTQGWSSYNWDKIFSHKPLYKYNFENGISTIVNINGKDKSGSYLTYPLKNNSSQIFVIDDSRNSFNQNGLFPEDIEYYGISKSDKKRKKNKPKIYVNFSPSKIPVFNIKRNFSKKSPANYKKTKQLISKIEPAWNNTDTEQLDEVVITAKDKEATRIEKIKNSSWGKVKFLDDKIRRGGMTLAIYLNSYTPYNASDWDGILRIVDPSPRFFNNPIPYIILDGVIINDFGFLGRFSLANVDYIEVNRSGLGSGLSGGGGGYIKIVTNPLKVQKNNQSTATNTVRYPFPLTFSSSKKFYTPVYKNYNSSFFNEYGTIAWFPNLQIDENGLVKFNFHNPDMVPITLYIEGTLGNGKFISESKTIQLNN
ncbi:hypothetical protein [Winogradskyella haliclonae]|uniref:TonB-dependent receptor plug domain-containing protein n=1 Tax=Winogradskyella haliclonae TaxID=2048558 RepID=A0ABQ2BVK1_9FLAO|nr:hypothetical protein [Winogradskyella haliclonae]GGI56445.1 hypothetical protein GCM10011444_07540 [Winogradskyella haliclonae]